MAGRNGVMFLTVVALVTAGCVGEVDDAGEDATSETMMIHGFVMTAALVPISGAQVTLDPTGATNVTDADGGFAFGPVESGAYRIVAHKKGYSETGKNIILGPETDNVRILLDAVERNVPYHEVQSFKGYVECSWASHIGPIPMGNFGCFSAIDLVLGTELSNDRNSFILPLGGPGFKGVMVEMFWEEQETMPYWSAHLRELVDAGGGVNLEAQYWSNVSRNPLRDVIVAGIENPGNYEGDVFHPDENATQDYDLGIAGMWDDTKPVDASVSLRTELEIFVTSFYYALPGEGYSAVECLDC